MSETFLSLKPSDAVHGGGMVAEGRYKITDCKPAMWDYNGTVKPAVPALGVEFTNADGVASSQYYSAGDSKNVSISADGTRFTAVGSTGGLNDNTRLYQFISALVIAGVSEDELTVPMSQLLIGMDVEVVHEKAKETNFEPRALPGQAPKQAKNLIPVIGKIHARPGETAKQAKATGKKANGAATDSAVAVKAQTALVDVLKGAEGRQMEKKAITTAVFQKVPATDTDRTAILQLCVKDEYLNTLVPAGILYTPETGMLAYIGE